MVSANAIYRTTVGHTRTGPVRHTFRHRSYHWLVDLDDLPRLPRWARPLARFESADHLGDPDASLRENVDAFLAANGIDLAGGRVLMLGHARVLGYVFNPITVYWCFAADGQLASAVAEVHNTYGGRHRYLLQTDGQGRAEADKRFYVSPFYTVGGRYEMRLPVPGKTVDVTVTLRPPDGPPFVASLHGRRTPATAASLLGAFARSPWVTLLGAAQIRWQGLRLWAKRVPVVPRQPATTRPQAHQPEPTPNEAL